MDGLQGWLKDKADCSELDSLKRAAGVGGWLKQLLRSCGGSWRG